MLAKINFMECFSNTKVAELGKIFLSRKFSAIYAIWYTYQFSKRHVEVWDDSNHDVEDLGHPEEGPL